MLLRILSEPELKNISLIYKALYCLSNLCECWLVIDFLFEQDIVFKLRVVTQKNYSQLVRVISHLVRKLICAPNDMTLWLKFDSVNPAVNSSGTMKTLYCIGSPKKLPPGFGIFRHWGAYFSGNDCIRIAGGLSMFQLPNTATITHTDIVIKYQ